eukprot:354314-Chlamydomonas_euryale.AAC.27
MCAAARLLLIARSTEACADAAVPASSVHPAHAAVLGPCRPNCQPAPCSLHTPPCSAHAAQTASQCAPLDACAQIQGYLEEAARAKVEAEAEAKAAARKLAEAGVALGANQAEAARDRKEAQDTEEEAEK